MCDISLGWRGTHSPTLAEDILQNAIQIYLQHGGNLFTARSPQGLSDDFTWQNLLLCCGICTWDWFSESLFHSAESWTVDELSSFGICFLGTVAQVNSGFRTRLKAYVSSYRSPLLAAGDIYADSLLESTFGIASVLSHFHRLDEFESEQLLAALCISGTPSMLRPFINAGINLNASEGEYNMLGNAAAVGNLDIVHMLMQNGANAALGLHKFSYCSDELSDGLFRHLLELLVENSRPTFFKMEDSDAFLAVIGSSRALLTHPEAPAILFRRKLFSSQLLKRPCRKYRMCSYMCVAISEGSGSVVELLLQHGAYANTTSSWLMFSVKCGVASCTEALIQHGADLNFQDGAGRSVLQVAKSNVTAPHPRILTSVKTCGKFGRITAEEDAETLAVVELALHLKAQSMTDFKEYESNSGFEVQPHNHRDKTMPEPQNMFEKAFGCLLTYYRHPLLGRHSRYGLDYKFGDRWSLSFREALLIRFFYVLSYILLLALEIIAFVQGRKRIQMPSRTILSAVALLLLAFIWGTSPQTILPSKPDSGRSVAKQDT